jgi:hypothetical protein
LQEDIILGADVLYDSESEPLLYSTMFSGLQLSFGGLCIHWLPAAICIVELQGCFTAFALHCRGTSSLLKLHLTRKNTNEVNKTGNCCSCAYFRKTGQLLEDGSRQFL